MKYLAAFVSICSILVSSMAYAFVYSRNSGGTVLRWPTPVHPSFFANWNNADLLSYSAVFNAFTNSFQRWKSAGSASIDFDYYQGGTNPTSWGADGKNAIFFQSQAPADQKLGGSTLGVTFVFSSSGTIVETDVEFNDENFDFTTNPSDSTQFGFGNKVFLENVATHEFGHVFGLNHSAVLQSSMVFLEDRGQAKLSCDDIQGIGGAYPSTSFSSGRGSIAGTIQLNPGATNIFGAHVLAVSKTRGSVVAGAITASDGSFSIPDLEPGDYHLMVEPFQSAAPVSSLCGGVAAGCHYGTVNSSSACGVATPFKRVIVESAAGVPDSISVASGAATNIGVKNVSCVAMSDQWGASVTAANGGTPVLINTNGGAAASGSAWGVITAAGSVNYFKLTQVTGTVVVRVLSYGLYSYFDPQVAIMDGTTPTTAATGASSTNNVFSNNSAFVNYDASATVTAGVATDYFVKVTNGGNLSATTTRLYPAGSVSGQIDGVGYYLLIVTVNDSTSLLPSTTSPLLANNARCESSDSFSTYPDLGPGASTASASTGVSQKNPIAKACGSISGPGPGDGGSFGSMLFSAWGMLFLLTLGRLLQRLARRFVAR